MWSNIPSESENSCSSQHWLKVTTNGQRANKTHRNKELISSNFTHDKGCIIQEDKHGKKAWILNTESSVDYQFETSTTAFSVPRREAFLKGKFFFGIL